MHKELSVDTQGSHHGGSCVFGSPFRFLRLKLIADGVWQSADAVGIETTIFLRPVTEPLQLGSRLVCNLRPLYSSVLSIETLLLFLLVGVFI